MAGQRQIVTSRFAQDIACGASGSAGIYCMADPARFCVTYADNALGTPANVANPDMATWAAQYGQMRPIAYCVEIMNITANTTLAGAVTVTRIPKLELYAQPTSLAAAEKHPLSTQVSAKGDWCFVAYPQDYNTFSPIKLASYTRDDAQKWGLHINFSGAVNNTFKVVMYAVFEGFPIIAGAAPIRGKASFDSECVFTSITDHESLLNRSLGGMQEVFIGRATAAA
jgi:hypothetical protein